MKFEELKIPAAGTWSRDCELISFIYDKEFSLTYRKEEDNTYWSLKCELIVAWKVISQEFSFSGYLFNTPVEGAFYEVVDSPWIEEFGTSQAHILTKCKHYILRFYDETVEIIAQKFIFEQLNEKPN